jgi:hypothetical protein
MKDVTRVTRANKVSAILGCESATNIPIANEALQTPGWCIDALIRAERAHLPPTIWEPCAGGGSIVGALRAAGYEVIESDLVPIGDQIQRDFLAPLDPLAIAVCTNPPWSMAQAFVEYCFDAEVLYLALLLKSQFLNYRRGQRLVDAVGYPHRIYGLTTRPDFRQQKSPPIDCAWFVWDWDTGRADSSTFKLLHKEGTS